jgi:ERCC4-type nuclease
MSTQADHTNDDDELLKKKDPKGVVNDTYETKRDEAVRIIYADDQVVLLREESMAQRGDRHIHDMLGAQTFEDRVDVGFYEPIPEEEVDIPKSDPTESHPKKAVANRSVTGEEDHASQADTSENNSDEQETESVESGKEGTETNASEDDNTDINSSKDGQADEPTEASDGDATDGSTIDWKVVDGIGPKTRDGLYDHGVYCANDIEQATDEELKQVNGVGESSVDKLRKHARQRMNNTISDFNESNSRQKESENTHEESEESVSKVKWSSLPDVGQKAEEELFKAGYHTAEDIKDASAEELEQIPTVGRKRIRSLYCECKPVNWKDVDGIGEKGDTSLRSAGIETISDLKNADENNLIKLDYIGEKAVKRLYEFVDLKGADYFLSQTD